jgi:hypothetical protein
MGAALAAEQTQESHASSSSHVQDAPFYAHPVAARTALHAQATQAAGRLATQRILDEETYLVRRVAPFPEGILRRGNRFDGISDAQWMEVSALRLQEGPCMVGPLPIRVAGVLMKQQNFFVWVEHNEIVEWLEADKLPIGEFRRGAWLLRNDGRELERIHDRVTDPATIGARTGRRGRDLTDFVDSAHELNRDLEHFVESGSTILHAQQQTEEAHKQVLSELIQGSFQMFAAWAAMESARGSIHEVGEAAGKLAHRKLSQGKQVKATLEQHALAALYKQSQELLEQFPHLGNLPATADNLAGLGRLADLFDDMHLPADVRERFLVDTRARLNGEALPPKELHQLLKSVAHGKPHVYLRQGARTSSGELAKMGTLKRAISLRVVLGALTTDAWYAKNAAEAGVPELRSEFKFEVHADTLVEAFASGRISMNPGTDLNPSALIKGPSSGSSGWWFSGNDVGNATSSAETMQSRLAVDAEYLQGYLLVELPREMVERVGAFRPTAIDLTVLPVGKLNPNATERVGRTVPVNPTRQGVREIVVPPVPLSSVTSMKLIPGGYAQ